jgi:hypothetical protein
MSRADRIAKRNYQKKEGILTGRVRGENKIMNIKPFRLTKWFKGLFPDNQKKKITLLKGKDKLPDDIKKNMDVIE